MEDNWTIIVKSCTFAFIYVNGCQISKDRKAGFGKFLRWSCWSFRVRLLSTGLRGLKQDKPVKKRSPGEKPRDGGSAWFTEKRPDTKSH